ncbi:hypothetical protein L2750_18345 [Shewanella submarina]|uniref:Uncharacterized protein n=1 Tax=Shewanella submarina TaxID=2016376 RepID=A0ABV7GIQ3_9GAMM|nr:hypothetical protein [Shewanella submarina]MCL1039096.1 hypothetical protein [Shewanella submarina]
MQISQAGYGYVTQATPSVGQGAQAPSRLDTSSVNAISDKKPDTTSGQIIYERHLSTGRQAISQYLHTQHASQREAISQAVGIDTYA